MERNNKVHTTKAEENQTPLLGILRRAKARGGAEVRRLLNVRFPNNSQNSKGNEQTPLLGIEPRYSGPQPLSLSVSLQGQ